jgi:hypothetical protein
MEDLNDCRGSRSRGDRFHDDRRVEHNADGLQLSNKRAQCTGRLAAKLCMLKRVPGAHVRHLTRGAVEPKLLGLIAR